MSVTRMIPARELKRRGIASLDDLLAAGPVYVIKNDLPSYVILAEDQYRELLDGYNEAVLARVRECLAERDAGRIKRSTAEDLIRELDQNDRCSTLLELHPSSDASSVSCVDIPN